MSNTEEQLLLQRERRLTAFISAVAVGAITKKNMPAIFDMEQAAAEIVKFAMSIEKTSRDLFEQDRKP